MRANKGHGDNITEDNRHRFREPTERLTAPILDESRAGRKGSSSCKAMLGLRDVRLRGGECVCERP